MSAGAERVSRRKFGAVALLLLPLACRSKGSSSEAFACLDDAGLSDDERNARRALGYVEPSADGNRACSRCSQYVPPSREGACGGCKVLKGPMHPDGTCKAFAAAG